MVELSAEKRLEVIRAARHNLEDYPTRANFRISISSSECGCSDPDPQVEAIPKKERATKTNDEIEKQPSASLEFAEEELILPDEVAWREFHSQLSLRLASINNRSVVCKLSPTDSQIWHYLVGAEGRLVRSERLLLLIGKGEPNQPAQQLRIHFNTIRRKLEIRPPKKHISNIPGVGYYLYSYLDNPQKESSNT